MRRHWRRNCCAPCSKWVVAVSDRFEPLVLCACANATLRGVTFIQVNIGTINVSAVVVALRRALGIECCTAQSVLVQQCQMSQLMFLARPQFAYRRHCALVKPNFRLKAMGCQEVVGRLVRIPFKQLGYVHRGFLASHYMYHGPSSLASILIF